MEYSSVRVPAGLPQPTPRCFHATMAVSDHQLLISGGSSTTGSLKDAFIFNIDTTTWSSITCSSLNGVPRAGHAMLNLTSARSSDYNKTSRGRSNLCKVLVFGGSDGNGKFYKDTAKFQLDLREDANHCN